MTIAEWNEAELKREVARMNQEHAELDAALAESMVRADVANEERDKAVAEKVRWMHEARYWYARAGQIATGQKVTPVIIGGVNA